ncbi:MAG: DUF4012 domain-containing protein [Dehalococcoidia bacterium]|nr:DUF4012 domain-containing protein [Dehalococcoidia bacterium]
MASAVVVPVLLVLAGWHYWTLYSSLAHAREELLSAQARLSDVGLNLSQGDIAVAREQLRSASEDLARARDHLRWDPIARGTRALPGTGGQVKALDQFLDMADLLVQIGEGATSAGARAVALRDTPPAGQPLTRSLVDLLDDTGPDLDRVDELTRQLVAIRLEMGDARLLPPLDAVRRRLDRELPRLANAIEQARQSKSLLPAFLGFHGDRKYLVLALNSGELLPGGGLVTTAGVLPVSQGVNGRLEFTDSTAWKTQWEAKGGAYIQPPGPLQRYLLRDFTWNLLVSNWTPDFPTWSQQALEFYELVHGPQDVNGVVAVDLVVLQRLLTVTGPKTLDVAGAGPITFDADNAIILLEQLTRQPFEPTDDRKSVVGELANVIIADLLRLPSNKWADAVDVMRRLGQERHIQILSFDAGEQTIIRDVRWDGRLEAPRGDFVQLNEASVLSTKLNLLIKPDAEYRIDVNALGDARHHLELRYHNGLPDWAAGKDPKLVQQLFLSGLYGGYLRLFGPRGLANEEVTMDGQPWGVEDQGDDSGKHWFGAFMALPPGASHVVAFRWTVALATTSPDGYDLYIQKQPGTDGMCVALSLTREGTPARTLIVTGGTRDGKGRVCLTTDIRVHARFS